MNCFYDNVEFEWSKKLEANSVLIKEELMNNLNNRFWLPEHPDYVNSKIDKGWQTLTMLFWNIKNIKLYQAFKNTTSLLEEVPGLITAQFSLLKANTTILPHKGYSKMVLRTHLPLIVPTDINGCALKIEDQIRNWKFGELLIFDDSYTHSAWNNTNQDRIVLMFDFVKPGVEYTREEICEFKLSNHIDPYLEKIAPKEIWLKWLKAGQFPSELEPPDIH